MRSSDVTSGSHSKHKNSRFYPHPNMLSVQDILEKDPDSPKLVDVYNLGDVVGKGAFGVVRSGSAKESSEKIACKTISKGKLVCKEDIEDVKAEIAIMNHVAGHNNVVALKVGDTAFAYILESQRYCRLQAQLAVPGA